MPASIRCRCSRCWVQRRFGNRRIARRRTETSPRQDAKARRSEDPKLSFASAPPALQAGMEAVRESQIQAALDREPFVSAILWLPDARSAWRGRRCRLTGWRTWRQPVWSSCSLRFFVSSILRLDRGFVAARQGTLPTRSVQPLWIDYDVLDPFASPRVGRVHESITRLNHRRIRILA